MTDLFKLILGILASRCKVRATLEAENQVLRQQVNVLRRRTPKRPHLNNTDRFLFVWLYRWFPSVLEVVAIVPPITVCEPDATSQPAPQDIQLMSKHRVLRFKPHCDGEVKTARAKQSSPIN